jgi:hypothetical protein
LVLFFTLTSILPEKECKIFLERVQGKKKKMKLEKKDFTDRRDRKQEPFQAKKGIYSFTGLLANIACCRAK